MFVPQGDVGKRALGFWLVFAVRAEDELVKLVVLAEREPINVPSESPLKILVVAAVGRQRGIIKVSSSFVP